ncbi:MAG: DUF3822 family protein [Bacteroidia bacterium]
MQATGNKIKLQRSIFDDSFDSEYNHYRLYMQVSDSGITACILKQGENKITALEDFRFYSQNQFNENFENVIAESRLFTLRNFRTVNCCVLSGNPLLIPQQFYSSEIAKQYFYFNTVPLPGDEIFCDDLEIPGIKNLFTFPGGHVNLIRNRFNSVTFCHHSSILIKSVLSKFTDSHSKEAFIYLRENSFDLLITGNRKLIYYNTFSFQSCEDFLYYVLFCFEQAGLNNDTIAVTIAGEKTPDFFSALNKYIPNISKTKKIAGLIFPFAFQNIPETEYFTLFSQSLCE